MNGILERQQPDYSGEQTERNFWFLIMTSIAEKIDVIININLSDER